MFMQNGGIGAWKWVKRRLCASLSERWFLQVQGSTDSEWAFAVFLDTLEREEGVDPGDLELGRRGFGHAILRRALRRVIERINALTSSVPEEVPAHERVSLLNFAVSDGHSVVCSRYVSSRTDEAASLFFSSGTSWACSLPSSLQIDQKLSESCKVVSRPGSSSYSKQYKMYREDKTSDTILIASEPLTFERDNWVTVPTNSIVTLSKQNVMIHPVIDEFYNRSPESIRDSRLAREMGQSAAPAADYEDATGTPLSNDRIAGSSRNLSVR